MRALVGDGEYVVERDGWVIDKVGYGRQARASQLRPKGRITYGVVRTT